MNLFSERWIEEFLHAWQLKMELEIGKLGAEPLLGSSIEEWSEHFESEFGLETPHLREEDIRVEQNEADVEGSYVPGGFLSCASGPGSVRGTQYTYFVPFSGHRQLLQCRTHDNLPPVECDFVDVDDQKLIFAFRRADHNSEAVRFEFERRKTLVSKHLHSIEREVSLFNGSLRKEASETLERRRTKLLKDRETVAKLGYPLRRVDNPPQTFVVPTVQRKLPPPVARGDGAAPSPDPTLDLQEYEYILNVISNMTLVMEKSPRAFRDMREEDIRTHFLVQLNGQYQGQATGETFNYEGKTDILVRVDGSNIFIGECKFWKGPKGLARAIDQLLGYASWRDTKAALIVFNRGKQLTKVLRQIPNVATSHPNYKRTLTFEAETGYRYVFCHRDDPEREIILTMLVFDVPA